MESPTRPRSPNQSKPGAEFANASKRPKYGPIIIFLLLAVVIVSSCTRQDTGPIVIGLAAGVNGVTGAQLAADQINAAGGIRGRKLKLDIADNGAATAAETSIQIAIRFLETPQVLAAIGHPNSPATLASSQLYNEGHMVQLVPNATSPLLTNAGPWTFRISISDTLQGRELAEYAVHKMNAHRVAILYVNDDYGKGLKDVFYDKARELGATVVISAPFDTDPSFSAIISYVKQQKPDLLFLALRTAAIEALAHQLDQSDLHPMLLAGDSLNRTELQANPYILKQLDGMRHTIFFSPVQQDPRVKEFVRAYRNRYHQVADDESALNYDAVYLLKRAIEGGGATRQGIRDYLATVGQTSPPFEGVAGKVSFDKGGDCTKPLQLAEVYLGKIIPLDASGDLPK